MHFKRLRNRNQHVTQPKHDSNLHIRKVGDREDVQHAPVCIGRISFQVEAHLPVSDCSSATAPDASIRLCLLSDPTSSAVASNDKFGFNGLFNARLRGACALSVCLVVGKHVRPEQAV